MMQQRRERDIRCVKLLGWLLPIMFLIGFIGGHFAFGFLGIF